MYRKALQFDRRSPEAWYHLGLNALKQRDFQTAGQAFVRTTELDPDNLDALLKLSDLHILALSAPLPVQPGKTLDNLIALSVEAEQRHPEAFEVLFVKARILQLQRATDEAIELLRQARALRPSNATVNLSLVNLLMGAEQYDEAEALLQPLLDSEDPQPLAFDFAYALHSRQHQLEEAGEVLREKCERFPDSAGNWIMMAHFQRGMDNTGEMEKALQRILDDPKTFPDGRNTVGNFYLAIQQPNVAMRYFREGIENEKDAERSALYRQGVIRAYLEQGDQERAAQELDALLDTSPDNPAALGLRGLLSLRSGDPEKLSSAIEDLEETVARMPTNYLFRFYLAQAHLAAGHEMDATTQLREALQLNEQFMLPKYLLAELYLRNSEFTQAEVLAQEVLDERPNDPRARLILVAAHSGLGEFDKARQDIEILRKQGAQQALLDYRLGLVEREAGDLQKAERLLQAALKAGKGYVVAAQPLFEVQMELGKLDEAQSLVESRLEANPAQSELQVLLARVAMARGQFGHATEILREVLDRNESNATAHLYLGQILIDQNKTDEALLHLRRAVDSTTAPPMAFFSYGTLLISQGDYTEGQQALERAVELSPDYSEALNNLAWAMAERGNDLDQALTYAQRAVARQPANNDFADTLGYIYIKRNLNQDAIQVLDPIVRRNPNRGAFRYHLGLAHYQSGNIDEARRHLRVAQSRSLAPEMKRSVERLLSEIGDT
jgi:predicted Zn-dependent protease